MSAIVCAICEKGELLEYKGRANEKCSACGGKARHRVGIRLYQHFLGPMKGTAAKCLHLAPEFCFTPFLQTTFSGGYIPSDLVPTKYPHLKVMKVRLPEGLELFPDGYFSAILHNHVLEHIPGHFRDHIHALLRVLAPKGYMIFSVPGPFGAVTEEGGELLATDEERLARFHKDDHVKNFGTDLDEFLKTLPNVEFVESPLGEKDFQILHARTKKAKFFILRKIK